LINVLVLTPQCSVFGLTGLKKRSALLKAFWEISEEVLHILFVSLQPVGVEPDFKHSPMGGDVPGGVFAVVKETIEENLLDIFRGELHQLPFHKNDMFEDIRAKRRKTIIHPWFVPAVNHRTIHNTLFPKLIILFIPTIRRVCQHPLATGTNPPITSHRPVPILGFTGNMAVHIRLNGKTMDADRLFQHNFFRASLICPHDGHAAQCGQESISSWR